MKHLILSIIFLSSFVHAKVTQEITLSFGYHTQESLSLRSYALDKTQGYAIVKVIEGREARFQKLTPKEFKSKEAQFNNVLKNFSDYKVNTKTPCFEKIEIKTRNSGRTPASEFFCWDHAPKNVKVNFERFWKSNRLNR